MRAKRILGAAIVAVAVPTVLVACGDDDDDNPVDDIEDTIESVVDDVTDNS
jgi:hypothetical protein